MEGKALRYVLLLRGINVGGKHKVAMSEFKALLLEAGFEKVSSYINSGNLFFSSNQNNETCLAKIGHLLDTNYDFPIPFALITKEAYLKESATLPDWWGQALAKKDVLFFSPHLDKASILDFIAKATFHNEIVHVGKHAIFWGKYDEADYLKTTYHKKLIKQDFYKQITIRNSNTFEKIAKMLENEK